MSKHTPQISPVLKVVIAAVVSIVAVVLIVVFLIPGDDSTKSSATPQTPAAGTYETVGPKIVSEKELGKFSNEIEQPIYWAGPVDGASYELMRTSTGNVFVRYLDNDSQLGSESADFVAIGTYPISDGVAALERAADEAGAELEDSNDGGLLYVSPTNPSSVYLAYPGSDYQIEVYSPDPAEALEMAKQGRVQPVL